MSMYKNLTTVAAVAALAFGLAACGGGGGDGDTPVTDTGPSATDQLADVNAAIAAEAAARMAVEALTDASTDADVMAARQKVAEAQAAAMKLAEDHSLRTTIGQLAMDLTGIETARTVASELKTVNDALDMAEMAVDALDRAGSTAEEVADARTKVDAAQTALNAATALSAEQREDLGSEIMGVDDTLDGIEAYRATDAGQLAVAEAAVEAAEELVDALTDESTPTQAGNAYAALQRAKQAVAAAENLPDNVKTRLNAKITELENQARGQSSITMALAEAAQAVADLDDDSTAEDVAAARAKVNAAKEAAAGLEDDDARKTAIASIDNELTGIENQRVADANKPGLDANAMALVKAIEGATLPTTPATTDISSMTGKPLTTSKLEASTMSIASIDGWMGNAYSKMNKAVPINRATDPDTPAVPASDDTVVVYNNKGDDEEVSYVDHFAGLTPSRTADSSTGALEVAKAATTDVISDMVTLEGTGSVISLDASGDDSSVKGTFHGLAGTFSCGAACTINKLSDGKYQTAGTLTFTPTLDTSTGADPNATQVANLTIMIADPDYMHFGYWKNASMKDGKPVYMVNAFSGGTMASPVVAGTPNGVQELEGSAKYAGSATGLYVRKEVNSAGDPQHLYHGQFTADAMLNAYFGGNDVAINKQYSIDGKITNFMDGDDAIDSTWSVTLMKADFGDGDSGADGNPISNTNAIFGAMTEGDKDKMGNWTGQFFGSVTDNDESATPAGVDVYPSGVAGEFNGHFVNGHVLGAFGADQVKE